MGLFSAVRRFRHTQNIRSSSAPVRAQACARACVETMAQQEELLATDTVIIVAYHLPILLKREGRQYTVEWDDDRGLHKDGMNLACRCIYVGCIDIEVTDKGEQQAIEEMLLAQYSCVVLFLDPEVKAAYYHGFCRGYLAPILSNQMQVSRASDPFQRDQWMAYCNVNQLFASKVLSVFYDGYLVWVHDYHLMLLPSLIVRKRRTAKVGFFLHGPFPASDVWRTNVVRKELLRGLLSADLIGFLLFEYTRSFLTCCKRQMGLEYEFEKGGSLGVEYEGRHVALQVSTFGISTSTIKARLETLRDFTASEVTALLKARASTSKIIVGVDYLDRLKGVANKLLAWEELLTSYPKYQTGHVLLQICISAPDRIRVKNAGDVQAELESIAERIDKQFPGSVLLEVRSHLSAEARLHLWHSADIHLCTALREAINVWPLEYVMARHLSGSSPGVVVLSEFTGFARITTGALRVNPFSQLEVVEALDLALSMAAPERAARNQKTVEHIQRCTLEEFARRFVLDLKSLSTKCAEDFVAVGFGLSSFRMVSMGSGFAKLDSLEVLDKFQKASRRALLLDWGGTLTPAGTGFYDHRDTADSAVPERVMNVLAKLCAEPNIHVMILSGLSKEKVLRSFGSVPNLSLAIEHGFNFRIKDGEWQELMPGVDTSWKAVAASVMSGYAGRTHGAYVQSKGSGIMWNFQEADPEFGVMQSKEVLHTLQTVLTDFPVRVSKGKGYVEASLRDVNKGATAVRFLDLCAEVGEPLDFVLSAGDDSTDELMFAALNEKLGKQGPNLITATVGRKPSEASSYLDDHSEVVELLELLSAKGSDPPETKAPSPMQKKTIKMGFVGTSGSHLDLASLA